MAYPPICLCQLQFLSPWFLIVFGVQAILWLDDCWGLFSFHILWANSSSLFHLGFPGGSVVKNLPVLQEMEEMQVRSLGWGNLLEEEMALHCRILAWRIPWTEEPGRLQPMGSQRVRHSWVVKHTHTLFHVVIHLNSSWNSLLPTHNTKRCWAKTNPIHLMNSKRIFKSRAMNSTLFPLTWP